MILEVYDIECLSNLFTYTGFDCKNKKYYQFVICDWRNDLDELYNHLKRDKLIQVGFNNENYDYNLIHHILNHYEEYKYENGQYIAQALYSKSQEIIDQEFSVIADKNKYIKQIDLFKIWHYNNKARSCSYFQRTLNRINCGNPLRDLNTALHSNIVGSSRVNALWIVKASSIGQSY